MCDPATLATISAVSAAVGTGGSLMSSMGAMNAQKKQQNEVVNWQRQQKQARDQESIRQEDLRNQATQAQQAGVEQLSGEAQSKRQADEAARLESYLAGETQQPNQETGGAPVSVADAALSGQNLGDSGTFQTDLAKKISEASAGAKDRIKALAKVSSYGDSFGGLGTTNPLLQAAAGSEIDKFNEFRRGSMGAFATEKAIDPVQVSYNGGQLADVFSTALQVGAQGLGAYGTPGAGVNKFPAKPNAPIITSPFTTPKLKPGMAQPAPVPWLF